MNRRRELPSTHPAVAFAMIRDAIIAEEETRLDSILSDLTEHRPDLVHYVHD